MPLKKANKNTWQYIPLSAEEKEGIVRIIKEASFFKDIPNIEDDIRSLDLQDKIRYLKEVIEGNHKIKGNEQIDGVSKWATEKMEKLEIRLRRTEGETTTLATKNGNTSIGLKDIFVNDKAFTEMNKLLAGEKLIDKDSGHWIDTAKGYKSKIVALLHDLGYKGYYKQDMPAIPPIHTIKNISKNKFGVDMSIDLAKGGTRSDNNISELRKNYFSFIDKYHP